MKRSKLKMLGTAGILELWAHQQEQRTLLALVNNVLDEEATTLMELPVKTIEGFTLEAQVVKMHVRTPMEFAFGIGTFNQQQCVLRASNIKCDSCDLDVLYRVHENVVILQQRR